MAEPKFAPGDLVEPIHTPGLLLHVHSSLVERCPGGTQIAYSVRVHGTPASRGLRWKPETRNTTAEVGLTRFNEIELQPASSESLLKRALALAAEIAVDAGDMDLYGTIRDAWKAYTERNTDGTA